MKIEKSNGVTESERLLAQLCSKVFLSFWCYPNPWKDDGKELCDVLAVFENTVFLFFDRESRVLDNADTDNCLTLWQRWKRKTIDDQIRTATGAERYVRGGGNIWLDCSKTVSLPVKFDKQSVTIYKIIVAHGAKDACLKDSANNTTGSVAVSYGDASENSHLENINPWPYLLHLDKNSPVHILDDETLPLLLNELDTITDFIWYYKAKETAIEKCDGLIYCGEEDLLAHYYSQYDENAQRHFIGENPENNTAINAQEKSTRRKFVMIEEGIWQTFSKLPPYHRKKQDDSHSYLWDDIIETTCRNALHGSLITDRDLLTVGNCGAAFVMAKEPRFARRMLSQLIDEAITKFACPEPDCRRGLTRNLTFMQSFWPNVAYVFLQLWFPKRIMQADNFEIRKYLLHVACGAAKLKFPHLQKVVGIVIERQEFAGDTQMLLECSNWTDEQQRFYEELNEQPECRFFLSNPPIVSVSTSNFPRAGRVS